MIIRYSKFIAKKSGNLSLSEKSNANSFFPRALSGKRVF
jgi:hypothetical protein